MKAEQYNASEAYPRCFDLEMRRPRSKPETAGGRLMATERACQEADAKLADLAAAEKERQRACERQRHRSMEGPGEIEAGTEIVGRRRHNDAAESVSVAGGVIEEGWDVVTSLDRRVARLEEWRDHTRAGQETTREQRLAETDALLRLADDARGVATLFAGRWRDEVGGDRSGEGLPG